MPNRDEVKGKRESSESAHSKAFKAFPGRGLLSPRAPSLCFPPLVPRLAASRPGWNCSRQATCFILLDERCLDVLDRLALCASYVSFLILLSFSFFWHGTRCVNLRPSSLRFLCIFLAPPSHIGVQSGSGFRLLVSLDVDGPATSHASRFGSL